MTYYCTNCHEYKEFEPAFECHINGHNVIMRTKPEQLDANCAMTEYDIQPYRCRECGEQPALIGAHSGQLGRVGLGCKCTENNQHIFAPLNSEKVFGFLVPNRWVVE